VTFWEKLLLALVDKNCQIGKIFRKTVFEDMIPEQLVPSNFLE
jgi:hypothetical protein